MGVHSGKFAAERVTENVRQAVFRLGVRHPVVNDRQRGIWRAYAVDAWPTLVLLDPEARVIGRWSGEVTAEGLTPVLEQAVDVYERLGLLDRTPLTFALEEAGDSGASRSRREIR